LKSCAGSTGTTVTPSVSRTATPRARRGTPRPAPGRSRRRGQRGVEIVGHDDPFAGRQAVFLHTYVPNSVSAWIASSEFAAHIARAVGTLAAPSRPSRKRCCFELGGGGGRAEAGDASCAHRVGDTSDKRRLGSDDYNGRLDLDGERSHAFGSPHHPALCGHRGGAGIAGCADQCRDVRISGQDRHKACSRAPDPITRILTNAAGR